MGDRRMTEQPWLIPADGMSRFRYSADGREMEIQQRERGENQQDMVRDGRSTRGERHPLHKLTEEQVRAIRIDPRHYRVIAEEYGISDAQVHRVRGRKTWSWLQ